MTPQKLPRHDWLIPEVTLDLVRQAADQYRQVDLSELIATIPG
jgi:hypothetical protein